jgi:hypothetical protein
MTIRELNDLHNHNARILNSPAASSSTYVQRISAEQAAIEARLVELDGMETINTGLKHTKITDDEDMTIDQPQEPPISRTIEAKRKALSRFAPTIGGPGQGSFSMQEAMDLERRAHAMDMERQRQIQERKKRLGLPMHGEVLTRQEKEARMWAFLNSKPSDSDMEDEDDEDDDDPASWFEDDQDDGRKGQDIVEPDIEDLSGIIRIDESRLQWSRDY